MFPEILLVQHDGTVRVLDADECEVGHQVLPFHQVSENLMIPAVELEDAVVVVPPGRIEAVIRDRTESTESTPRLRKWLPLLLDADPPKPLVLAGPPIESRVFDPH